MPKPRKSRRARGTGTVFFHESRGVWVGRAVVGRTPGGAAVRVERSARTQAEVLAKLAAAGPPASGVTLAAWVARWLAQIRVRPTTAASRERNARLYLVPTLGGLRVADVTPGQVEQAVAIWSEKLSPGTVRTVLGQLKTCLNAARRAGLRADNPVSLVAAPKLPRTAREPYPPADLARIVEAARERPCWHIFALVAATGCRGGEALALDVTDYDPRAGTVSITKTYNVHGTGPPKTAAGNRTVRVPAPALPALKAAAGKRKAGPLFPTGTGKRNTHANLAEAWGRLVARLGLPRATPHHLRHSVASAMVGAGVPLANVAAFLGDSVDVIVKTYLHPSGADAAGAMEGLLGGA